MKYIAYGSNMVQSQMASRCPTAKLIGLGWLFGTRLEFYRHATVEPSDDPADYVPVALWEIYDLDERRLDQYEGYPDYYRKEVLPIKLDDGTEEEGMIYLMNDRFKEEELPSDFYIDSIWDAYRDLGLEEEISNVLLPAINRLIDKIEGPDTDPDADD